MLNFDVNKEAPRVHDANRKWWQDLDGNPLTRNKGEQLMLVISELAEAMEGVRKDLMDDHLPHRKMEEVELADALIRMLDYRYGWGFHEAFNEMDQPELPGDNVGEVLCVMCGNVSKLYDKELHHQGRMPVLEAIDWSINTFFWYAEWRKLDLLGAYEEKMAYNATRHDHTIEGRKEAHGKKW